MVRAPLRGLYAITDAALVPADQLLSRVEAALCGGVRIVQYRDKQRAKPEQLIAARQLQALCSRYEAPFIINDDIELCLAADADGVHLGRSDGDIAEARARLGPSRIVGATCHDDLDYAQHAHTAGADYCAFGRLFSSQTKPHAPPCPLARIGEAKQLGLQVVGIGGITLATAPDVLAAGADMLAVIHDLFAHADVEAQAARYAALF